MKFVDYDLVVCGAGPAGTAAAITAARGGLRVGLLERYGFAGGMATSGLVNPWMGHVFYSTTAKKTGSLIGGFFKELVTEMSRIGAYGSRLTLSAFDEERLKWLYDRLLLKAGVEVHFHTWVAGVERKNRRLLRVETISKEGRKMISARYFIDATGDGDIAAQSGCPFTMGRPGDGLTQSMTLSFRMGNVDKIRFLRQKNLGAARLLVEPYFQRARRQGRLIFPFRNFVHFYDYPLPGVLHFNMTRINRVNGLSVMDLTRAEMEGRRQACLLADWLIKEVPFFRKSNLIKMACQVGVRETRHVHGLYIVTRNDIVEGRKFPDGIVRSAYPIDVHSPVGSGFAHEKQDSRGAFRTNYCPPAGDYYEVPYRSLVPPDLDNLLVACRALSADHEGMAAVRVMATMTGVGQAAGLAATRVFSHNTSFIEVPAKWLRKKLAYLDQGPDFDKIWW